MIPVTFLQPAYFIAGSGRLTDSSLKSVDSARTADLEGLVLAKLRLRGEPETDIRITGSVKERTNR